VTTTLETKQAEQQAQQAAQQTMQIATGYIVGAALQVAVKLEIADQIAAGVNSTADLARESGVEEDPLYRIMRTFAAVGVFEETAPRSFAMTPAAATLRNVPGSMYDMVLWLTDPLHNRVYAETLTQ
jgi:hypothetical protein